jgi:hypothetical protein
MKCARKFYDRRKETRDGWRPEKLSQNGSRRNKKGSLLRANAHRVNTETEANFQQEGRGFSGYVPQRGRLPYYPGA